MAKLKTRTNQPVVDGEGLLDHLAQDGTTTQVGGNLEVDGTLKCQGGQEVITDIQAVVDEGKPQLNLKQGEEIVGVCDLSPVISGGGSDVQLYVKTSVLFPNKEQIEQDETQIYDLTYTEVKNILSKVVGIIIDDIDFPNFSGFLSGSVAYISLLRDDYIRMVIIQQTDTAVDNVQFFWLDILNRNGTAVIKDIF